MRKINTTEDLRAAILELEGKRVDEARMMKERVHYTLEKLKPANLLKSAVHEVETSPQLQDKMLNTGVAMAVGQLSKILVQRTSKSPFKRLIGSLIMLGVTHVITQNPQVMKNIGLVVVNLLKRRSERRRLRAEENDVE